MSEETNLRDLTTEELLQWQAVTGNYLKRDDIDQQPFQLVEQWRKRIARIDAELLRRYRKGRK